jgi:WD40 repeat protein
MLILLVGMIPINSWGQFYNGTKTDFGKNRVQYDKFEWQYYRFKQFETYFYTGGKELAQYTSESAGKYIRHYEQLYDFYLQDKIQFIVYNKHSHFKQSNVGIVDEVSNVGGVNTVVGTKVFVYFNGDHKHLEDQIKTGIARVYVYNIMYGGGWKDAIKNSTLASYPPWYIEGLVRYNSKGWDSETKNRVKDGVLSSRYRKFSRLEGEESIIAGHSLWYFVAQTYGEEVIPNILYMTKLSRNVETGFLFVLGIPLKTLMKEWLVFYQDRYELADKNAYLPNDNDRPQLRIRKDRKYTQLKVNADGTLAYATNKMGQYKVYTFDPETGKRKKIMKREHKIDRLNDYSYPLLAWHPTGEVLAIITEQKGKLLLYFYEPATKALTAKPVFRMEKVLDLSYSPDGRNLVLSGTYEGKSDIYLYNIPGNSQRKITDDFYDDLHPRFLNNKQIVFSSNRTSDTLDPADTEINKNQLSKDLFIYTIPERGGGRSMRRKTEYLSRVTNTPNVDELHPMRTPKGIGYLKVAENDIWSRHFARYDSAITTIDTVVHYRYFYHTQKVSDYSRNIMEHESSVFGRNQAEIIYNKGKYQLYIHDIEGAYDPEANLKTEVEKVTVVEEGIKRRVPVGSNAVLLDQEELKVDTVGREINIDDYVFSDNVKDNRTVKKRTITLKEAQDTTDYAEEELIFPGQRNYNLSFSPNNSIMQLNSAFLTGQYQNFNGGPYVAPGLGGTFIIGITDVFENYKLYGGFRYSGSVREYSLSFQNLKQRMDKEVILSLSKSRQNQGNAVFDVKTYRAAYSLKWPFSEVTSLRMMVDARNDRFIPLATDFFALQTDVFNDYWSSVKASYVFDNTIHKAVNIYYGTRFKFFGEYYRQIGNENANMQVLGLDFRHYQKIHRELIFVNRLASSTSFGQQKLIFYLGSVDDWWRVGDVFDFDQPIDFSQNYRFQTLGANMRGFIQNVRNGNSFAVINSELRWPVFKYFIRRPIKSQLIANFQLIGFGDIGTAWTGLDPYSEENAINSQDIFKNPFHITLKNNSEPIVGGYGFGLRTMLLGYFIRLDWAWGVKDQVVQDRIFYLSLSLDI